MTSGIETCISGEYTTITNCLALSPSSHKTCKWGVKHGESNISLWITQIRILKKFLQTNVCFPSSHRIGSTGEHWMSSPSYSVSIGFNSSTNLALVIADVTVWSLLDRASWKTEPQTCGGNLRATTQPQDLKSPGYPKNYPGGLECLYILTAQQGRIITLEVSYQLVYHMPSKLKYAGKCPLAFWKWPETMKACLLNHRQHP